MILIDAIGWIGALILLIAYALVSLSKIKSNSIKYQLLNIIGSVMLVVNTLYHNAFPSTFVNVIWIGIAVVAMVTMKKD